MPRSRGGSGGRRPAPAPQKPAVASPQQSTRNVSTAAHPPMGMQQSGSQVQQPGRSPGLFGQMASTAAGVAVGSSIGHAVGGLFGGGTSAPAEQQQAESTLADQSSDHKYQNSSWGSRSCEPDAKSFTQCLDQNQGNMQICGWYLEQLKACQQAASQY